uniref:Ubiquinone/menaquinone biosynthesis C-methylase UbiE n=1 Tax=Candidatus Kentrum sp. DK TaxID=2126562 RepID=A0A450TJW6_9GAMM|nr:MAG: Ubiquinone/menaquinone biosynthesis C-methylase UbiE [Candidatus Kentron sp. DK]
MNDIFEAEKLLDAYDRILPLARHYKDVLSIHQRELDSCKDVIDLGCGTGNPTLGFLRRGIRVTAVDVSQKSLDILKKKAVSEGFGAQLTILQADITNLGDIPSESFDGASSSIVAHLLKQYERHIEEGYRVLKPSGRFVITARCAGRDPALLVESTKDSLIASGDYGDHKSDFEIVRDNLLMTANNRSSSLMSEKDAEDLLHDAGFRGIRNIPNKTLGVMYTFSTDKPYSV